MLGGKKIKLETAVYDKVRDAAEIIGATSLEEFVAEVLDREAERVIDEAKRKAGDHNLSKEEVDDITAKLQGLGYLD